ncbi:hypothetical protein G7Y79_00036g071940 [Physcia stellaris]|nr:hypothetical protein G7Y79_00036g071940 [Physcia stellaris]
MYLHNVAYPFSLNNSTRSIVATASGGQVAGSASNANASQPQGHCCFVVQDTFNVNYWANQYTSTFYGLRRITSVVAFKTQYEDTIITRYATSTTIKNTTYLSTYQNAKDGVYASNGLVGPQLAETLINGTITTFHRTAIASPTGFFAYPSVKIINVPAVKDAGGQLACATSSIYTTCLDSKHFVTFESVNSAAEAYFGTLQQSKISTTYMYTQSTWYSIISLGVGSYTQETFTGLTTRLVTGQNIVPYTAHNTSYSTAEITFSSPFLYFPTRASTERTVPKGELPGIADVSTPRVAGRAVTSRDAQDFDSDKAVYGYVPSELIKWILQNTDYVAQYPSLGSCIPGGPSLLPLPSIPGRQDILTASDGSNYCQYAAPEVANAVPDLTTTAEVMVQSTGCFHPGNCQSKQTPTAAPASPISSEFPRSTNPSSTEKESHSKTSTETKRETQSSKVSKVGSNPSPAVPLPVIVPIASPPVQTPSKPLITPEQTATLLPVNNDESGGPAQTPVEHQTGSSVPSSPLVVGPEGSSDPRFSNDVLAGSAVVTVASLASQTISRGLTPIATVGSHRISASNGVVVVAGSTLSPGGPAITLASTPVSRDGSGNLVVGSTSIPIPPSSPDSIFTDAGQVFTMVSGTPISLGSSQLIVGSSTVRLPEPSPSTISSNIVVAGQTFAQLPDGISVAGTTLRSQGPAVTISGTPISLGNSGVVIGATTFPLPTAFPDSPSQTLTLNGQTLTAGPDAVAIAGNTLTPNGPAVTISGTPISVDNSGIVIGSSTFSLPTPLPTSAPQTFTLGGQTFTVESGGVAVAGTTLGPHAPGLTISGTSISLGLSSIIIGSSTFALPTPFTPSSEQTFTIGGQVFTATSGVVAIAGSTLSPNGPGITVSGTPISLAASDIIIGSSSYSIPLLSILPSPSTITFNGETLTLAPSAVAVGEHTLSAGQAITINGTEISLGTAGLVVGSSTLTLSSPTQGLGEVIMGGLGAHSTATASGTGAIGSGGNGTSTAPLGAFTGDAKRLAGGWRGILGGAFGLLWVVRWWIG